MPAWRPVESSPKSVNNNFSRKKAGQEGDGAEENTSQFHRCTPAVRTSRCTREADEGWGEVALDRGLRI
jgi:hypothetical protein